MREKFNLTMIDDDINFLRSLSMALEEDFKIFPFHQSNFAMSFLKVCPTDAIILDLHMEEEDGFSLCAKIRRMNSEIPVFFLTSDDEAKSISQGIDLGCADYFLKSIPILELKTRINGRLRNLKKPNLRKKTHFMNLSIDMDSHLFYIDGNEIALTPKEYDIIKVFMERPNQLLTKQQLLKLLWQGVHVDANNIDTHMFHIRKKFKSNSTQIFTKKGLGYILRTAT